MNFEQAQSPGLDRRCGAAAAMAVDRGICAPQSGAVAGLALRAGLHLVVADLFGKKDRYQPCFQSLLTIAGVRFFRCPG